MHRMAPTSRSPSFTAVLTSSSHFQRTVCLYDWWLIKATEDCGGKKLAVGGVTSREYQEKSKLSCTRQALRMFSSSPIIKRHEPCSLETADGICVVLKGLINKDRTMGNGFSSEIFNHFVFGFPAQWKDCAAKYLGQESGSGAASPQEENPGVAGFEKSVPSSLNNGTPINYSKERHDTQNLEESSRNLPEVTTDEGIIKQGCQQTCDSGQEQNCGDILNQDGDQRRRSNRLSGPSTNPRTASSTASLKRRNDTIQSSSNGKMKRKTRSDHSEVIGEERLNAQKLKQCSNHMPEVATGEEIAEEGSQPTCDVELEQNCGHVMNQDGGSGRNSNTSLHPPIEPGIANSAPRSKRKRNTKQGASKSKIKRRAQRNLSKVISEERNNTEISKECIKHVHVASTDEGIAKEGSEPTRDVEQGQDCGDVMDQDGGGERNPSTLLQPPIESGVANSTPDLKRKRNTRQGASKEGSQPTHDVEQGQSCGEVRNQDSGLKRKSRTLFRRPVEPGIANSTPGLIRKRNIKQGTSNSEIKRKINFDASGKSVTKEAKESMPKVSSDASSFKRSRSGRLLIPLMEYWRNQVPVYDRDRSITGILEDSTVTPLRGCKSEPPKKRRR